VTAFGVVVRIEQLLIQSPFVLFQRSQSPAKANISLSRTSKQYGCFDADVRFHSEKPSAGVRHLRNFNGSENAGFVLAVSDLALIVSAATEASFAQEGMSPHRINEITRTGSFGFWRTTGTSCVGAIVVARGSSYESVSKYCSST
jgi:hypothetical protein